MKFKAYSMGFLFANILTGCAITPHSFLSTYEPGQLPKSSGIEGVHTLKGSAFLRQKGGGVVTCAGEEVKLTKELELTRNAYANEYLSLPYYVKNVTPVDTRLLAFEEELAILRSKHVLTSQCDVDGRFTFENIAAGDYSVLTKVEWYAGQYAQGGYVSKRIKIAESKSPKVVSVVIDN